MIKKLQKFLCPKLKKQFRKDVFKISKRGRIMDRNNQYSQSIRNNNKSHTLYSKVQIGKVAFFAGSQRTESLQTR